MKRKMILLVMLLLCGFGYSNAQYGPVVSFSYDDGASDWYDIGFPVFQEYGFPGVVYINATNGWIQQPHFGAIDKLLEMQATGWEISSHTYDHNGIEESNVSLMKDWLDANGFPNSGFGAPNNIWDHRRVNIIKRYHPYYAGFYTHDGGLSQPFDIYFLQRFNLSNARTIEEIRGYLDDAVANNKWIIFYAHRFGGTYGDGSTWLQSEELVRMVFDEIVLRGIPVKTVREVITDLYPPGCVIECSEDTLQDPVLTYFEEEEDSLFSTSVWNEYWQQNTSSTPFIYRGSPVVYCHTSNDSLPVMKFYSNVPNGEYEVRASIIAYDTDRTYRLYYSFDEGNPSQYNVEVNKNSDVYLGPVTVTDGQFALYTQKADAVSGGDGYVGWAFIKLFDQHQETIDGQFITNISSPTYSVTIAVNLQDTTGTAGVVSLEFTYNNTDLSFPTSPVKNTDYALHGNFDTWVPHIITRPSANAVRINFLTTGTTTPPLVPLSPTPTNIITLYFTILNQSGSPNLQWVTTNVAPQFTFANYKPGNWPNLNEQPLPVELLSFTGKVIEEEKVELEWVTKTEVSNYGFEIERNCSEGEDMWEKIGFLEGHGNTNSEHTYYFVDRNPVGGSKFSYRLKQIDTDGKFEYSDEVEIELLPTKYELYQNYPNPFNPSTTFRFSLPKETQLKINVYNMLGELVETLAEGNYEAGYHKVAFNASNLPSGVYVYRIESNDFVQTKKMMLLK